MHIPDSNIGNVLNALSLVYAIENLQENREQSKQNDVQSANDKQAQYLLEQITKQFEKQNKMLMHMAYKIETIQKDMELILDAKTKTQSNNT